MANIDFISPEESLTTRIGRDFKSARPFSGGELQRIALARALATYAPVTILDEPTAKLDRENDAIIMHNLFHRHRTAPAAPITIVISHNYGHIQEADEILYFEKGFGLLEHGPHDELMLDPESHYRKLFLADQAEEKLREILD